VLSKGREDIVAHTQISPLKGNVLGRRDAEALSKTEERKRRGFSRKKGLKERAWQVGKKTESEKLWMFQWG